MDSTHEDNTGNRSMFGAFPPMKFSEIQSHFSTLDSDDSDKDINIAQCNYESELETSFSEDKDVSRIPLEDSFLSKFENASTKNIPAPITFKEDFQEFDSYPLKSTWLPSNESTRNCLNDSFSEEKSPELESLSKKECLIPEVPAEKIHFKGNCFNNAMDTIYDNFATPAKSLQSSTMKERQITGQKANYLRNSLATNTTTPQTSSTIKSQHLVRNTTQSKVMYSIPMSSYKAPSTNSKPRRSDDKENQNNNKSKVQFNIPKRELFEEQIKTITVNENKYLILRMLGRGGSSVVFHCFNMEEKLDCAIKKVNLCDQGSCFINEVHLLSKLSDCDKIIKMFEYEVKEEEKEMYVVMEKGDTDLANIIKRFSENVGHLPMYILIHYWMEMLYAVKQIHDKGIVHTDLKPSNFMQVQGKLKLIDFGIASSVQADCTSIIKDMARGSFNYISPEALNSESSEDPTSPGYGAPKYKISYKTDVWSLGCILYQLVYKRTPFQYITKPIIKLHTILDPDHVIIYPEANWVPPRIIETIKACLRYNMKSRPSIDDLINEYEKIYY